MGGLECRRVFQFGEIVFIRAVPHVHFKLMMKIIAAFLACLPVSRVRFNGVMAAERKPPVIARTTVSGVGKKHVPIFIVADPVSAAFGFGKSFSRTTA